MNTTPRPGAPVGNRNAAKPARDRASALVQIRVKKSEKLAWKRAAASAQLTLSQWIASRCNR